MGFVSEFREFAIKGNVIDLAVGVIIGGAFGKITDSLVKDVILPPLGLITGKIDFSQLYIDLSGKPHSNLMAAMTDAAPLIRYGLFINNIINFLIMAFVVFLMVKAINKLRRVEEAVPAAPTPVEDTKEQVLLTEIRDLLAKRG